MAGADNRGFFAPFHDIETVCFSVVDSLVYDTTDGAVCTAWM